MQAQLFAIAVVCSLLAQAPEPPRPRSIVAAAISADGKWIATADSDANVALWDSNQEQPAMRPLFPNRAYGGIWEVKIREKKGDFVQASCFSPDQKRLHVQLSSGE